jgi:outer membrane receptor for ferric coprogen and ferric-rhodotorulic acid
VLPALTAAARWQNKTWQELDNGPNNVSTITQSGYTIIDLFTRYQVSKNFAVQAMSTTCSTKSTTTIWVATACMVRRNFSVNASYSF